MTSASELWLWAFHDVAQHGWAQDGDRLLLNCASFDVVYFYDMPQLLCLLTVEQALVLVKAIGAVGITCGHMAVRSGAPCPGKELQRRLEAVAHGH